MPMASSRAWKPVVELELVLLNHVSESDIPIVSEIGTLDQKAMVLACIDHLR